MARIFFILALFLAGLLTKAQDKEFENDIKKFQSIKGRTAACDISFEQMVPQFKMEKAKAP